MSLPTGSYSGGAGGGSSTGALSGGLSSFDASGWNIVFGSGSVESKRTDPVNGYLPYVLVALAALVAWRMTTRK